MDFNPLSLFPRTKIGRDHQLRDAFRHGKVIDRKIDEELKRPVCRVQFLDKQGLISYWLPIKQFGSRLTSHFYVPKIGDDVNVNMLANGVENGFIDGSYFNKNNPMPEGLDIDTRHFKTEDGTIIEYREIDSTFLLDASGAGSSRKPSTRAASGGVVIVKAGEVTIEAGTITETGTEKITLTAPEIELTGHMIFNGLITHTGDMTTSGVHTDANGIHMGAERSDEVAQLRAEVAELRQQLRSVEQILRVRGIM